MSELAGYISRTLISFSPTYDNEGSETGQTRTAIARGARNTGETNEIAIPVTTTDDDALATAISNLEAWIGTVPE